MIKALHVDLYCFLLGLVYGPTHMWLTFLEGKGISDQFRVMAFSPHLTGSTFEPIGWSEELMACTKLRAHGSARLRDVQVFPRSLFNVLPCRCAGAAGTQTFLHFTAVLFISNEEKEGDRVPVILS